MKRKNGIQRFVLQPSFVLFVSFVVVPCAARRLLASTRWAVHDGPGALETGEGVRYKFSACASVGVEDQSAENRTRPRPTVMAAPVCCGPGTRPSPNKGTPPFPSRNSQLATSKHWQRKGFTTKDTKSTKYEQCLAHEAERRHPTLHPLISSCSSCSSWSAHALQGGCWHRLAWLC